MSFVEDALRGGGSCMRCQADARLLLVTPCAHLLCMDCGAADRWGLSSWPPIPPACCAGTAGLQCTHCWTRPAPTCGAWTAGLQTSAVGESVPGCVVCRGCTVSWRLLLVTTWPPGDDAPVWLMTWQAWQSQLLRIGAAEELRQAPSVSNRQAQATHHAQLTGIGALSCPLATLCKTGRQDSGLSAEEWRSSLSCIPLPTLQDVGLVRAHGHGHHPILQWLPGRSLQCWLPVCCAQSARQSCSSARCRLV